MNYQDSIIKRSIQEIHEILNHWTNLPLNGQPPYSPLPEETVGSLKEQLERLKKCLAEYEKAKKEDLKNFIMSHEIKISCDKPKWLEPILLEPTRFEHRQIVEPTRFEHRPIVEPTRFEHRPIVEHKLLKTKPHKKSDGWKQANKNPRGPVCRY